MRSAGRGSWPERTAARCGGHDKLEKSVRKVLKTSWDQELVEIYGDLETSRPAAHLAHIEAWLARRGDDPVLLLAAAKLCIQNQLWGKARSYLESSLALRPVAEGYRVYGQLLEKMGEPDAAAEAFRLGLEAATVSTALPALSAPALAQRAFRLLARMGSVIYLQEFIEHEGHDLRILVIGSETFAVGEFKDRFGLSRKWAIPLLEHLDSTGVTRRLGDQRQVVRS